MAEDKKATLLNFSQDSDGWEANLTREQADNITQFKKASGTDGIFSEMNIRATPDGGSELLVRDSDLLEAIVMNKAQADLIGAVLKGQLNPAANLTQELNAVGQGVLHFELSSTGVVSANTTPEQAKYLDKLKPAQRRELMGKLADELQIDTKSDQLIVKSSVASFSDPHYMSQQDLERLQDAIMQYAEKAGDFGYVMDRHLEPPKLLIANTPLEPHAAFAEFAELMRRDATGPTSDANPTGNANKLKTHGRMLS